MAPLPVGLLQPHLPCTAGQKHNSETDLVVPTPRTREQSQPITGQWKPQSKEEALPNIQHKMKEKYVSDKGRRQKLTNQLNEEETVYLKKNLK